MKQEVVVLKPVWEHIVRNDAPPAFPHLFHYTKKKTKDLNEVWNRNLEDEAMIETFE